MIAIASALLGLIAMCIAIATESPRFGWCFVGLNILAIIAALVGV